MATVRPAAVAGSFYPADRGELIDLVQSLLHHAADNLADSLSALPPAALLVPHAGYIYSGFTAAVGYRLLQLTGAGVRRVVLLGPSHRHPLDGLAVPEADRLETPLGLVPVAPVRPELFGRLPQLTVSAAAHAAEHSLEVQLPFLQLVLPEVPVLPLVVGRAGPDAVAQVIEAVADDVTTLVLVSSDLSHYLPYRVAQRADAATVEQILRLGPPLTPEQACGAAPVNGLLVHARRHRLDPQLLAAANSADTAGSRARVVGYACVAFSGGRSTSGADDGAGG